MIDSRRPLAEGTKLKFENGIEYEILKLIGRGANCLVYDAVYFDKIGAKHLVRLKELFPIGVSLKREEHGVISCENYRSQEKFEGIKNKFTETYKKNTEIRNIEGLVNSTSNVQELQFKNGTCYTICDFNEGIDYRKYKDHTLFELLKHIRTVAKVLKKYHERGYLHLDIKPENIFILPETAEHIMLFDFDSVIEMENLKHGFIRVISYTAGFSAPEQVRGNLARIGTYTDVYSVGAVLFYKIFGEMPPKFGIRLGMQISTEKTLFQDEVIYPGALKLLKKILNKTLMTSGYARWQTMDPLIEALDEIIPMVDPEKKFIVDNFVYNEKHFVGRDMELQDMHNILKKKQSVFLSGIGGIGKTELAKRYAYSYGKEYNTIVFLRFDTSLKHTILSQNLEIKGFDYVEKENEDLRFREKFDVLKKIAAPEDLLIIDNFDVDYDDDLEELLECKCKFIFTTREDYRDYNYEQIDVECMNDLTEAYELFYAFNDKEYSANERNNIEEILKFVEYHTMMIVLLSKYLRDSEEQPSALYAKFLEVEGITNIGDTKVKHRKDKKLRAQRVNMHLKTLFEFSKFTDIELQIMRALSLLGSIRIRKSLWLDMVGNCFEYETLDQLIKRGWIEADSLEKDCKISLHQIILDLVYNEHCPNTDNCSESIKGYINYLQKKVRYAVDKRGKKKIADILLKRVHGEGYLLAQLYYSYCKYIRWKPELLKLAEKFCLKENTANAKILLVKIETLEIEKLEIHIDLWNLEVEQIKIEVEKLYEIVHHKELTIFQYMKATEENKEFQCKLLMAVADALCSLANRIYMEEMMMMEEEVSQFFLPFYKDAEDILLWLENQIFNVDGQYTFELKENFLTTMIKFYDEDDFCRQVQAACVGNSGKSAYYTEQIGKLRSAKTEEQDMYYLDGTSYMDAADQAAFCEKYDEAIELYKKALQNEESLFDDIMYRMCTAYEKQHRYEEAEKAFLEILDYDIERGLDPCFTYQELIELYKKEKDFVNVEKYSHRIIEEKKKLDPIEEAEWMMVALIELVDFGKTEEYKNQYMEMYMDYLKLIEKKTSIDNRIVDSLKRFLRLKTDLTRDDEQFIKEIYHIANYFRISHDDEAANDIYSAMADHKDVRIYFPDIYIHSVLWIAQFMIEDPFDENYDKEENLLLEVKKFCKVSMISNDYYKKKCKKLAIELQKYDQKLSDDLENDAHTKCDYYYITKYEISEAQIPWEEQFQMWSNATEEYLLQKDPKFISKCMLEMKESLNYCVSIAHLRKYIEQATAAMNLLDQLIADQLKSDLIKFIVEKSMEIQFDDGDKQDLIKCFYMEILKTNYWNQGISIFMKWMLYVIQGKSIEIDKILLDDPKDWKEQNIKIFMQENLKSEIPSEIVLKIESVLMQIKDKDCEIVQELEEIKQYYEQTTIEYKH